MPKSRRYCLITPCRDESRYARRVLDAVTGQTIPPALWIIVDDGSKDESPAIIEEYARRFDYIRLIRRSDRGDRALGGGVVDAFYTGYETIQPADFEYICKFDLDLDIPRDYFERMIERMESEPRLGTCSGKPYFRRSALRATALDNELPATTFPIRAGRDFVSEKCGDENSVGMIKFYRTECFRDIGGFERYLMWDGIDGHRCRMLGWRAESWDEPEVRFEHLRPMGTSHKSWWRGRVRHGVGQYFMGTSPVYMLASATFRMTRPPVVMGGIAMMWGYLRSALTGAKRYEDPEFRRFLRRYQWSCLLHGKKAATRRLNERQAATWGRRHPAAGALSAPATASATA